MVIAARVLYRSPFAFADGLLRPCKFFDFQKQCGELIGWYEPPAAQTSTVLKNTPRQLCHGAYAQVGVGRPNKRTCSLTHGVSSW